MGHQTLKLFFLILTENSSVIANDTQGPLMVITGHPVDP